MVNQALKGFPENREPCVSIEFTDMCQTLLNRVWDKNHFKRKHQYKLQLVRVDIRLLVLSLFQYQSATLLLIIKKHFKVGNRSF